MEIVLCGIFLKQNVVVSPDEFQCPWADFSKVVVFCGIEDTCYFKTIHVIEDLKHENF